MDEISKTPHLNILMTGVDGGAAEAYLTTNRRNHNPAAVVFSWGGGWDHVSVSYYNRTPTWEEMCEVKDMFFRPDEACIEYHPAQTQYVNNHPYCLHIWRPQQEALPVPPTWMVGARKGQTMREALREAGESLGTA